MRVLVAGGAGFIGSHLCESLINDNFDVICIDNLITGDKKNVSGLLNNPKFKFIEKDVSSKDFNFEGNVDFIFHLASPASPSNINPKSYIHNPIQTLLANSLGTHNLLEVAKKNKAKFLYASSSEVYGDPEVSPQKEDYFGNVNPVGIRSVYDEGKRYGEAVSMTYFRKYNLDTKIIRIFNTYGPKMSNDGRVVINFIKQSLSNNPITVYGDGKQTRSFCYVDDLVEALKKTMLANSTKGLVLNIGNQQDLTILDLANMIKNMTNSKSEIIFEELPQDDPKIRKPDITLAKKLIDWEAKTGIEEGLQKTIDYFKSL